MGISNITLVKIAAIGGIITSTMGILFKSKIEANVKATDYYKEAIKTLRNSPEALQLLGEPIKEYSINVGDEKKNYTKQNEARYEVPVSGPKNRGRLCFFAEREDVESSWIVKRVELELDNHRIKKIIINSERSI